VKVQTLTLLVIVLTGNSIPCRGRDVCLRCVYSASYWMGTLGRGVK